MEAPAPRPGNPFAATAAALVVGGRSRAFWLLARTFFTCAANTVGVGTHLIPAAQAFLALGIASRGRPAPAAAMPM
ncbi:MAG TPA: hypothetical protein VK904_05280 [Miltoncostaeaceae bacterium]|nr:hypothetical protein [Miltoncostaeaceae bacterium]